MKVVVCLFGLCRGNSKTWNSLFENLIKPLEADVFFHSWLSPVNQTTHTSNYQPGIDGIIKFIEHYSKINGVLNGLKFDRQKLHFPEFIDLEWGRLYFSNQINMFKSIKESAILANDCRIEYDYYVFTRTDVLFKRRFDKKIIESGDDFLHGGVFDEGKNVYNFEDVFFVIKAKHINMLDHVLNNHILMKYVNSSTYNILLTAADEFKLAKKEMPFKYGIDFEIQRPYELRKRIFRFIRKNLPFYRTY